MLNNIFISYIPNPVKPCWESYPTQAKWYSKGKVSKRQNPK